MKKIFFKKNAIAVLLFFIVFSVLFVSISCKDNRTPRQKAYDFMQMFDSRSHLKFRGGIYEYDEGKKIISLTNNQSKEDKLESYSNALEYFQKATTFFNSAIDNAEIIKTADENALIAIEDITQASELYIEATNIYINALKTAANDENFDIKNALMDTYSLEYKAEKKVLTVHENIKIFEGKYPEIFSTEWKVMLDELIEEQKLRLENISTIYEKQSEQNN